MFEGVRLVPLRQGPRLSSLLTELVTVRALMLLLVAMANPDRLRQCRVLVGLASPLSVVVWILVPRTCRPVVVRVLLPMVRLPWVVLHLVLPFRRVVTRPLSLLIPLVPVQVLPSPPLRLWPIPCRFLNPDR